MWILFLAAIFEYLNNEYNINIIVEFCGDGSNN